MITFTEGNLLEADADALVNTVNTVGVMGKGVALMFKEAFPENFAEYEAACKEKRVRLGEMFVTERKDLLGPRWIVNFPTKAHWRYPSQLKWIEDGLNDLARIIEEKQIRSIAIPPLGSGNGGLKWAEVRSKIENLLGTLQNVAVIVYEPTAKYQNVAKRDGVEKLTAPRALIAEMVRRYSILGIECTLLEVQKLGYFLERSVVALGLDNKFKFEFEANKYGPYSDKLKHMLNGLDGSYLHCDKRIADAGPFEPIRFDDAKKDKVAAFLTTPEAKPYRPALEATSELIDGLESPHGMELLSTVDWLITHESIDPEVNAVREAMAKWPGDQIAAKRKLEQFDERVVAIALDCLAGSKLGSSEKNAPRP
jgi:O-acetyl-ADP-ribose deacetylase (regulator of RNase III)